jgi:subtilase family serine protease
VKNEGTAPPGAVSYARFYLSADQKIMTTDLYLGQRSISSSLAPGVTSSGTTTVTIPATVTEGTYYVGAIADATGLVTESKENNNAACDSTAIAISSAPKPDLVVTVVDSPSAGAAGGAIAITSTVKNIGTAGPGAASYVRLYLASDQTITTADLYLGQRYVSSSLAPGTSSSGTTSVTIPATVTPGTYFAGAIADATGLVTESNENNNAMCDTASIVITAAPKPDLVISSLDAPASGKRGSYLKITSTVKNQGGARSSSSYLKFYLSTDSVITTGDRYIGQRTVTTLDPGATTTASSYITLSTSITPGSYYIGAIADATNIVGESDENNNIAVDQGPVGITSY